MSANRQLTWYALIRFLFPAKQQGDTLSWQTYIRFKKYNPSLHSLNVHLRYPDSAFKVATFDRWLIVVSGWEMVEELPKRPQEELSGPPIFQETFRFKYVFESVVLSDRYHAEIATEKLLENFSSFLPDAIGGVFKCSGQGYSPNYR
ncbi:hypothetical protein GSI_07458 [Ganoderma sinense ZZ0214-1]|uniref:Uncharacterized protein n=1 Tax=Ganoderma sinense ZZ0214-1 TaxID=1077348 RepID=A0A2G8S9M0_9APHY|nr:hypothetical protein GSI_07458 [Ganoderma sinense ZZ0214-1]